MYLLYLYRLLLTLPRTAHTLLELHRTTPNKVVRTENQEELVYLPLPYLQLLYGPAANVGILDHSSRRLSVLAFTNIHIPCTHRRSRDKAWGGGKAVGVGG